VEPTAAPRLIDDGGGPRWCRVVSAVPGNVYSCAGSGHLVDDGRHLSRSRHVRAMTAVDHDRGDSDAFRPDRRMKSARSVRSDRGTITDAGISRASGMTSRYTLAGTKRRRVVSAHLVPEPWLPRCSGGVGAVGGGAGPVVGAVGSCPGSGSLWGEGEGPVAFVDEVVVGFAQGCE
jgi:hypothetical protein